MVSFHTFKINKLIDKEINMNRKKWRKFGKNNKKGEIWNREIYIYNMKEDMGNPDLAKK